MSSTPPPPPVAVDPIPKGWSEPTIYKDYYCIYGCLTKCPFAIIYGPGNDYVLQAWKMRYRVAYDGHIYDYYDQDGIFQEGALTRVKTAVLRGILKLARKMMQDQPSLIRKERSMWQDFLMLGANRSITMYMPKEHPTVNEGLLFGFPLWAQMCAAIKSTNPANQPMAIYARMLMLHLDLLLLREPAFTAYDPMSPAECKYISSQRPFPPGWRTWLVPGDAALLEDSDARGPQHTMHTSEFVTRMHEFINDLNRDADETEVKVVRSMYLDEVDKMPMPVDTTMSD